jgi:O-methyltransferase
VDLVEFIAPYTLTGLERRKAMAEALVRIETKRIPGDIVECGVWLGGNIIMARKMASQRVCWLYDTFTGMAKPGEVDGQKAIGRYERQAGDWCRKSLDEVKAAFHETGVYDETKLRFVEGMVEDTLPKTKPERIALLRLDTDWYSSTKIELELLYPRLSSGGVLIVDDYGHWDGARKAVDEYFPKARWVRIDYTAVMMVKP